MLLKNKTSQKKKLTLIELIIVIVIIGILAGMALPKFMGISKNAKVAALQRDLEVVEKAMNMYMINNPDSGYPVENEQYFKNTPIPETLKDSLILIGDNGTDIRKIDMDKLAPYIDRLKYGDNEYLYSMESETVIDPIGKVDDEGIIHHFINEENSIKNEQNNQNNGGNEQNNQVDVINFSKYILRENYFFGLDNKGDFFTKSISNNNITQEGFHKITLEDNQKVVDFEGGDNGRLIGMILTDKNNIYMWGYDGEGAIGNGDLARQSDLEMYKLDLPSDVIPSKISIGGGQAGFITTEGDVYMWGRNYDGETGVGEGIDKVPTPTKIDFPTTNKIVDLELGIYSSGAIDSEGKVYMWGLNGTGSMGFEPMTDNIIYTPSPVPLPVGVKITYLSVEQHTTMMIDKDGNGYYLGSQNNMLLLTDEELISTGFANLDYSIYTLTKIDKVKELGVKEISIENYASYQTGYIDKNNKFYISGKYGHALGFGEEVKKVIMGTPEILEDKRVVYMDIGANVSSVMTDSGDIYYWGKSNVFNSSKIYSPTKIELKYSDLN